MGKGGCISEAVGCVRAMAAFVCCLVCTGPILLIVGIVMIVSPNNRASQVAQYNTAITTFQSGDLPLLKTSSFSVTGGGNSNIKLTLTPQTVVIRGNTDGINTATSDPFQSSIMSSPSSSATYSVASTLKSTNALTFPSVSPSISTTNSYYCDSRWCSSYCTSSRSSSRQCYISSMVSDCHTKGGSFTQSGSGSYCYGSSYCGSCTYQTYPAEICFVVKSNTAATQWVNSNSKTTCRYPFTSQKYTLTTPPSSVTFSIYSDQDPRVQLEAITQGSNDFGLTAAQQRGIGLGCAAIGGAVIGLMVMISCCLCRSQHRNTVVRYKYIAVGQAVPDHLQYNSYGNVYGVPPPQPAAYGYAQQPQAGYGYQQPPPQTYAPQPGYQQPGGYGTNKV